MDEAFQLAVVGSLLILFASTTTVIVLTHVGRSLKLVELECPVLTSDSSFACFNIHLHNVSAAYC